MAIPNHLHGSSLLSALEWLLNFFLLVIPVKIVAAHYVGQSSLADAVYGVL